MNSDSGRGQTKIVGILLAAGRARRFGQDKRLQMLPSGITMIVACAHALLAAVDRALVVLRPDDQALGRNLIGEGVDAIHCPDCDQGMGSSIACGVRHAEDGAAWLIALADMPYLRIDTIRRVADALRAGNPLVAAAYNGRRGHPVGFGNVFRAELTALAGNAGGGALLKRHAPSLHLIATNDPGVITDVDVPDDLPQPWVGGAA